MLGLWGRQLGTEWVSWAEMGTSVPEERDRSSEERSSEMTRSVGLRWAQVCRAGYTQAKEQAAGLPSLVFWPVSSYILKMPSEGRPQSALSACGLQTVQVQHTWGTESCWSALPHLPETHPGTVNDSDCYITVSTWSRF